MDYTILFVTFCIYSKMTDNMSMNVAIARILVLILYEYKKSRLYEYSYALYECTPIFYTR